MNSFNSLFYIAFFKSDEEGCYDPDDPQSETTRVGASCRAELSNTLMIIFIVAIVKNLVEVGLPFVLQYMKKKKRAKILAEMEQRGVKHDGIEGERLRTKLELEFDLMNTDSAEVDNTYSDYMELMI